MNQTTEKRISPRKAAATVTTKTGPRKAITAVVKPRTPLAVAAGVVRKFFVFVAGARPSAGERLAAHTNAAIIFTGLAERKYVKKAAVIALLGQRAYDYHHGLKNFEVKGDTVRLTTQGYNFFKDRAESGKVSGELSEAFFLAITEGKPNAAAQIKKDHLQPVSMAVL